MHVSINIKFDISRSLLSFNVFTHSVVPINELVPSFLPSFFFFLFPLILRLLYLLVLLILLILLFPLFPNFLPWSSFIQLSIHPFLAV